MKSRRVSILCLFCLAASGMAAAQVSYQDILNSQNQPQNWLTFSSTYAGLRYGTVRPKSRQPTPKISRLNGCFRLTQCKRWRARRSS